MEKFLSNQSPIARCNIIQMMHNWQNTGSQKRKFYDSALSSDGSNRPDIDKSERLGKCPMGCTQQEEPFHFMRCRSDVMYNARDNGLSKLSKGLKKLKTAPSLLEAIIQGIKCWSDDVEYNLDDRLDPLLFSEGHTQLLKVQSDIGWEFFLKGYICKEWGHLQESYYRSIKANAYKFTRTRWVVKTLMLLHEYRTSQWHMRNAALYGGYEKISKHVFRTRLLSEVRELYKWDRSLLLIADKHMFKLPLLYHLKQGNQHLLLWVKRAYLMFDSVKVNDIPTAVQSRITSWLSTWKGDCETTQESVSDIITWSTTDAEIDKSCADTTPMGDNILEGMSQQPKVTDATCCTE
jgi:hypothetical protein